MKTRPQGAWSVVGILWFVAMLNYLDRMMITTMREPIKASIAMTDAQFGVMIYVGGRIKDAQMDLSNVFQIGAGGLLAVGLLLLALRARAPREIPSVPPSSVLRSH